MTDLSFPRMDGDENQDGRGAAYVFQRTANRWTEEAYITASNSDVGDRFGRSVTLSADGSVLAVGASHEDSAAEGVGGDETSNTALDSGAVYLFRRGVTWAQMAYVKSSNPEIDAQFGTSVVLSSDGTFLVAGAPFENAVYVYRALADL